MRLIDRALSVGCLLLGLAACTTALPPDETPALGDPFNEAVKEGYVRLASAEWEDANIPTSSHFTEKARAAMLGDVVWPDKVGMREVPAGMRAEAIALRERLLAALEAGGRERAPEQAAAAQVNFDCWLRELAGRPGSETAVACREAFLAALDETEESLAPIEPFVVFFESGADEPDATGRNVIARAARAAADIHASTIQVVGYTDQSGSSERNQTISENRAQAVADALIAEGVPAERITVEGRGEVAMSPISAENRRVEIRLAR